MARYRPVYTEIWNDEDVFLNYSDSEKTLFFYFISNNDCTESGIYKISPKNISSLLCWNIQKFDNTIKKLYPNVEYDEKLKIVFIKNFYKYNGMKIGRPDLIEKSIVKDCLNYPCRLWYSFIKVYSRFEQSIRIVLPNFDNTYNEHDNEHDNESEGDIPKKEVTWRDDFDTYKNLIITASEELKKDTIEIAKQQEFYPKADILKSIEKGIHNFWGKEAGWKHKKKSRSIEIDARSTLINSIKMNIVYKDNKPESDDRPEYRRFK